MQTSTFDLRALPSVLFALACYGAVLVSLVTFILFASDVPLGIGINQGASLPWPLAVLIDVGLVLLWGVQHSVMARQRFKDWWTRIIPAHTERAFYCLASAVALLVVCLLWVPIGGVVWEVQGPAAMLLRPLSALGWLVLLAASFEIDHFDLFGVSQPVRALRGVQPPASNFQTRFLYRVVRHPIQLGVLMGIWFIPTMTAGHLLFAVLMTVYIHIGLYFEERALVREFGQLYLDYASRVPKLVPWPTLPSGLSQPATAT
ncbi:MAG: hypothetical protein KTR31_32700 [Myxococcales bacterium]|nr:hypothetical protein [Myxococcales bacterium]